MLKESKSAKEPKKQAGNPYVSRFLSFRSAPDIMGALGPISNYQKEITESMAILTRCRDLFIRDPMKIGMIDLCAGNALTSVTAVHIFPVREAVAIDLKPRQGASNAAASKQVRRFSYLQADILKQVPPCPLEPPFIVISSHPCGELSRRVMELGRLWKAEKTILLSCCVGQKKSIPNPLKFVKLSKYEAWTSSLAMEFGNFDVERDNKCMSPCNLVLVSR